MQPGASLLKLSAIALVCFFAGRLTVLVTNLDLAASPIWFPAGVALGVMLLGKANAWIGVGVGSFLLALSLGAPWPMAVSSAIGTTLSAIAGKALLQRVGWSPALHSLRDAIKFLALAVLLSPTLNATINTLYACFTNRCTWDAGSTHWWAIALGDGIGILVMTPLLLVWVSSPLPGTWLNGRSLKIRSLNLRSVSIWLQSWWQPSRWRILEALLWLVLLLSTSLGVFDTPIQVGVARYPLEYLPLSLIVWAALRFGQRGTVLSGFIVSSFAFWGVTQHRGPFFMDANGNPQQAILLLQAFVGVTMGTALMLAATIAERQQAESQLRFAAERERLLAETAQRIRRSLDLDEILQTTVDEIRHLLQADRVFVLRVDLARHSLTVAESVHPEWSSVRGWMADQRVADEVKALFKQEALEQPCSTKPIRAIDDTDHVEKPPLLAEYYRYCQVRASIGIPIMVCNQMFGILLVNQCSQPRHWQPLEINLLEQLATQVEIAIQQAQLYQHVQTLAVSLEGQVQERTAELQQRMQELQSLNQVKDLLLHAVAHDLRTPVQGMLMVLNSLRSRNHDCPAIPVPCTKVDRMIQSCDHQLNLLNSLLEGHRDDRPATVLHCRSLHLHQVIDSALANLKALLSKNQITLHCDLPSNLPPIKADAHQIQQVIEHLLLNAVKHNAPGLTVTLSATIEKASKTASHHAAAAASPYFMHCTIADDGRGMSQEQCDRLFQLYIRGIDNQHLTGIGLGLYRCRQIITAHAGEIGVVSTPGQGSQFWFTLPCAEISIL